MCRRPELAGRTDHGASWPCSRRGWAWEFLRRNADYREDWQQLAGEVLAARQSGPALRLRPAWQLPMSKWGLIFRR